MDRLSTVIAALALCLSFGCEREGGSDGRAGVATPERVAAVAAPPDRRTLEDLCDVLPEPEHAPRLRYPPLSSDSSEPPATGWRWINLWATWCVPCVEEIPMLRDWQSQLAAAGVAMEVVFVSVDESAEAIEAYLRDHPDAPRELRVADPEAVPAWVAEHGLDAGATIPVHVVVDPEGRVRCLRGGKVYPRDFPLVERLLASGG
jgi:thiol-disulfide isomerase/thioredoxin